MLSRMQLKNMVYNTALKGVDSLWF